MTKYFQQLKKLIKNNELQIRDLSVIVEDSRSEVNLTKHELRVLVNLFEKNIMKNLGILSRKSKNEIVSELKKKFHVENIVINTDKNIDQTLRISDVVYTFDIGQKLDKLKV